MHFSTKGEGKPKKDQPQFTIPVTRRVQITEVGEAGIGAPLS